MGENKTRLNVNLTKSESDPTDTQQPDPLNPHRYVFVKDPENPNMQNLTVYNGNDIMLNGMLIKDYPTFVRIKKKEFPNWQYIPLRNVLLSGVESSKTFNKEKT